MTHRLPRNMAAGYQTRFYLAREVIPWEKGDPKYECALNVGNPDAWSNLKIGLIPKLNEMREKWETVTHIVEIRASQTGSEEYEQLWTVHELPVPALGELPIGPYKDFGTW